MIKINAFLCVSRRLLEPSMLCVQSDLKFRLLCQGHFSCCSSQYSLVEKSSYPTCSIWARPIKTEGICPSIPGSLRWPSNHVPGMAICDRTGLLGTAGLVWPSWGSADWFPAPSAAQVPDLSLHCVSAWGLPPPELLTCSNSSITHSWESASWGKGLTFTAT